MQTHYILTSSTPIMLTYSLPPNCVHVLTSSLGIQMQYCLDWCPIFFVMVTSPIPYCPGVSHSQSIVSCRDRYSVCVYHSWVCMCAWWVWMMSRCSVFACVRVFLTWVCVCVCVCMIVHHFQLQRACVCMCAWCVWMIWGWEPQWYTDCNDDACKCKSECTTYYVLRGACCSIAVPWQERVKIN